MAKAVKARNGASLQPKAKRRANKAVLSLIALFVTLVPLFSAGVWVKNTFFSDPRYTVELQEIKTPSEPVKLFEEPIIAVTFDDGWESIYSSGAKIFEKNGVRTTQYVLSGTFDYYNYLSKAQILSLQKAGHDIESHTVNHNDLTSLDNEDLLYELRQSKADISKLTGKEVKDFASPLNRYNDHVIEVIEGVYRSHRNTEADIITLHEDSFNVEANFDPHQINAFSVRRTTTVPEIQRFIERAKELNALIVLIYHQIEENEEDYYAVSPKALDEQLAAIAGANVRIATIAEVMDAYEAKQGNQ
jgi:peptidoglycan/xylan/chitin deacetylase (PgdA/CDA1 family)